MSIHAWRTLTSSTLVTATLTPFATAQVNFSIDHRSPTITIPSPTPITAADLLVPAGGAPAYGPLPPPVIFVAGGPPGLGIATYPGCVGAPPILVPGCPIELDALSRGLDDLLTPAWNPAGTIVFSVDEFAMGAPGSALFANVLSEAPAGDSATDVFMDRGLPPGPLGPIAPPGVGNSGIIDGNGTISGSTANYPGLGLIEPNFGVPGPAVDGDDLDALDIMDAPGAPFGTFFSLDAAFFDPALGLPNTGSAAANGFLPGAVLVTLVPGGPPVVYAPPALLGLDLMGPGTDDLDALILCENTMPGYQVSPAPYAWGPGAADQLIFSVRRGSAVIGMPDSIFGAPIMPGDLLIPPPAAGMAPGIFIAAEWLGLATTRTLAVPFGGDDIDALDARRVPQTASTYCHGTAATCPCGNAGAPGNGCANSIFAIGANLAATGNAQVSADTVVLTGTNMPNSACVYIQGTARVAAVFGDGLRCVGGGVVRLGVKFNVANTSAYPVGADPAISIAGGIPVTGGTRHYQVWYRDALAFCTASTFNLSNGVSISWTS